MKPGSISWLLLLFMFLFGKPSGLSALTLTPASLPAILTGTVSNAITGFPVIGAKISVNNKTVWSVYGGAYSMVVEVLGTYPVTCLKVGFDAFTSPPVTFQSGVTVTMNIGLWENLNPPAMVTAALDTLVQAVQVSWTLPNGDYELLYDDGIQDSFTVWAFQGNMHGVRFTPVMFPATLKGGSVHLGEITDYPAGANPLVPFQIAVYDAAGTQGMPGNLIAGPFDVVPVKFGWNEFTFPTPVSILQGDYYLVMIQGGNAPTACGIAIDNTATQLRSVSRFYTGGAPWVPAGGNYMMRSVVNGPGGPMDADTLTESLVQYLVWRLRQGEEQNPSAWIDLGMTTELFYFDQSWATLPCGPYRWAVKSEYSGNRWSPEKFSNVIGKCWTVAATVDVELSCGEASRAGASIRLKNLVYPDTVYSCTVDTSGHNTFPTVWKGTYQLTVKKFGYQDFTGNFVLTSDMTIPVLLLQEKPPPTNLQVDEKSLVAQWLVPTYNETLFAERWNSGSFATQNWTVAGGTNWIISSVIGNPSPSAMFSWSPQVQNYNQTLTGKTLSGLHSPILKCNYDIMLDNFSTTTLNQMAVEIWDGSSWNLLKNYTNSNGDFSWITEQLDVSPYTDLDFRIRFRAYGEDSYDINAWNVDNIVFTASETSEGLINCILGYNFYVDNVLSGFTTDTKYIIPGPEVQYGQTYTACVLAVFGSGYSTQACTQFTSAFLYPPRNLTATPVENNVFLEWLKPKIPNSSTPPGIIGYNIFRNSTLIQVINDPDALSWYDFNLEPGTYNYEVSARYELTAYGFPGQFDESMRAGPVTVALNFGRELPFFEPWDHASFDYNDWRFEPVQGNWIIDNADGTPAPSARFTWEPIRINYSYSLESPVLDATPFECASIWLDFDLKLEDRFGTGLEKLCVEIYYNNIWHKITQYLNGGSIDWQGKQIDISAVTGQAFRIRFRTTGGNSSDILGWYVDNVHVYPVCYPARNLEGESLDNDVLLTWSPPNCEGTGGHMNEGFEGASFPPPGWDRVVTNPTATWEHTPASSSLGAHSGNFSAGIFWDYTHQDEWLIATDILVSGNLTFWSRAFQGSIYNDHYYVKVSPDGGATWDVVLDMSALPPYPGFNGYNLWETPYTVNMTLFLGQVVDIAWHAVDGDGQGLWYSWAIDDCVIGTDAITMSTFDIFRRTGDIGDFERINTEPVSDTSYHDEDLMPNLYRYYVLALSPGCQQPESSDTITVDVITSQAALNANNMITLYPNPANNQLVIESTDPVFVSRIYSSSGRLVLSEHLNGEFTRRINTESIPGGLYFLRITTSSQSVTLKIIITH